MWISPWDNAVRGGEQVVHSLWAFATGGLFGTGLGLGDPEIMPAAHTDLILAVLGEEWGWVGVASGLNRVRGADLYRVSDRDACED